MELIPTWAWLEHWTSWLEPSMTALVEFELELNLDKKSTWAKIRAQAWFLDPQLKLCLFSLCADWLEHILLLDYKHVMLQFEFLLCLCYSHIHFVYINVFTLGSAQAYVYVSGINPGCPKLTLSHTTTNIAHSYPTTTNTQNRLKKGKHSSKFL